MNRTYGGFHTHPLYLVILIVAYFLLAVALLVTSNSPATGYEASIYRSTPTLFWIAVAFSTVCGIVFFIVHIYRGDNRTRKLLPAFLLIFLSYAVCLSLFIIRGYYMWCMGGDPATHIGWIKETICTGYVPDSVIYPITHIYFSEIVQVTGLDLVLLHKMVPLIFALLMVPFMYLFACTVLPQKAEVLLATLISCTMIYGWYTDLTPNGLANLFLPLVLYLLFKFLNSYKISWCLLLCIALLFYPVFHPIPTVFLGLVLLILLILYLTFQFFKKKHSTILTGYMGEIKLYLLPLLVLGIWFIFWISSFRAWDVTIQNVLGDGASPTSLSKLTAQIEIAQGYGYNVLEQIVRQMGGQIVLVFLALISLPLLWQQIQKNNRYKYVFSLYGPIFVLGTLIAILYVFYLPFGPLRLMFYVLVLSTVSASFLLYWALKKSRVCKGALTTGSILFLIGIVLVGLFLGGITSLYPSPYVATANYHTTQAEVEGMDYLFAHMSSDVPILRISIPLSRYGELLLTSEEIKIKKIPPLYLDSPNAPYHFGYDNSSTISMLYPTEHYLIISEKDRSMYVDTFPDMAPHRWWPQDFERLNHDPGLNLLYVNSGFDLWMLRDENT